MKKAFNTIKNNAVYYFNKIKTKIKGKKKKEQNQASTPKKVSEVDTAILQLKVTRDKLRLFQKTQQQRMIDCKLKAKQLLQLKQKDKAKIALQTYKVAQKQLQQAQQEEYNLEVMIQQVESAQVQSQVFDALKQGNKILKELQQKTPLSEIEKVMSETNEAIEYQNEISSILSQQGVTDQDLLNELNQLDEMESLQVKEQLEELEVGQDFVQINYEEKKQVIKESKKEKMILQQHI